MDTDVASFGGWVKQRRSVLHLTQEQLGKLVHCATVTIRKIEGDVHHPSPVIAERLAAALQVRPEQQQLFCKVARGEHSADWLSSPDWVAFDEPLPHLLPTPATSLVGRAEEVQRLGTLVREDVRLVTLSGPPGVGKTRLVLQLAHELQQDRTACPHDGIWFVPLAPVLDPAFVASTVQQRLGLQGNGHVSPIEQLKCYLANRQLLLILDNCEHLLEAMPLVSELLAASPGVKVLATSRAVLHLSGEHEFLVPPLDVPHTHQSLVSDELLRYPAVQLFVQRARAVRPGLPLTEETIHAIAAICQHLDGLPLAIELAAARTKLFVPQALRSRLDHRLTLLTGGARDLPARQQTLRAAIDWSYSLLDADAQTVFTRLAVFVGGCTLPAVEAVCATANQMAIDVLDGITRLVDHSLVQQHTERDGEPRFTLLETVREYGLEQLAARGEMEVTRQRHTTFFLSWLETVEPLLYGAEQREGFDRIELELPNIRAALACAHTAGITDQELRLAVALGRFWYIRGYISEGRRWFDQALTRVNNGSTAIRTRALIQAADLAKAQNDVERGITLNKEAIMLCERDGNNRDRALALHGLAELALWRGDYASARRMIEEAVTLLRVVGDPWMLSTALFICACTAELQNDRVVARCCAQQTLALLQAQGDRWSCAGPLFIFGRLAFVEGKYSTARARYEESVTLWRELNDRPGIRWGLRALGLVALLQKDFDTASQYFIESMIINHEMDDEDGYALCVMGLAATRAAQKQPDQALRAARLYGNAQRIHSDRPSQPYPDERITYERELAAARVLLGETAFTTAYAEGQAMTHEQVMAYVEAEENDIP